MTTTNTVNISEIPVDQNDKTKTTWGANLSSQYYFVIANGTDAGETFDAADLSDSIKTMMAQYGRGIAVNMGGGNDTIVGSAYGDTFNAGAGTNYVDGGAQGGSTPNGAKPRDVLNVFAASQEAVGALAVTALSASSTGADADAWAKGYRVKVTNGTEIDYLKDVEQVNVFVAQGAGFAFAKTIRLAVDVSEADGSQQLGNYMHLAWAQGTAFGDTFNAQTDVSAGTRALMDQNGRGVWVDLGAGDDTVTGSGYGDDISVGSGTNYVDGGDNAGSPPWGGKAADVLHVTVASQAAADAVQVVQLTAASTGADALAFKNGFTTKIVAGAETDYLKGIERVSVVIDSGNGNPAWARDIALTVVAQEANLADPNAANYSHLAWVKGTAGADAIDASAGSALLSDAIKAAMDATRRGVWIDGGAGGDTITGSAYSDYIRNGAGNDKVDGGANAAAAGHRGMDVFEITVASTADMAAVKVEVSDNPDYQWMVTYGAGSTQKDYLKNVEGVVVAVTGGAAKWIPLALDVYEVDDATSSPVAWVQGTAGNDSFDPATDLSAAAQANLAKYQHGVVADLGAGNDTATGTGYGDQFNMGAGTNYVDGGANAGTAPWGGRATDVLHVDVATQAAADAVQVTALAAGMTGPDADAFAKGYTHKVVAGAETDYIKGIERIVVTSPGGAREIALEVMANEISLTDPNLGKSYHLAWVNGTAGNDIIDASAASALLSDGIKAAMDANKRGVWIDGGAGNDVITGTAYADNFRNGAGSSKIDGGANAGPNGQKGMDVFEVSVASSAELSGVRVQLSDDPNYQWMVTYGANSTQKDYLKNIEGVSVNVAGTSTGKWIPLALTVGEVASGATGLDNYVHFAAARGTALDETFNAATDVSAATRALMDQHGRGVYADMGGGNDTVVGSGYGDTIIGGTGTNYIDGGANAGSAPGGAKALDTLEIYVASQADADAVSVTELTASMTGADGDAYAAGYRFKLANGSAEVDYVKDVEKVNIFTWTDRNGDGQRDYSDNAAATEVAFARSITLAVNNAPTFGGAPAGVAVSDAGYDYGAFGGTVLASGKMLAASYQADTSSSDYFLVLNRSNADGSVDTTFGNGTGRVTVPTSFNTFTAPVELADGKLLVGVTTFGSANGFKVMRLNADGSVDTTFGTNGATTVAVGSGDDVVRTMAVDANGKIVLAGSAGPDGGSEMALVRLNADGSVDNGFNGSGKMTFSLGTGANAAVGVSFTADGKLVVTGYGPSATGVQLALVRVNADGTLDAGFGSGGKLALPVTAGNSWGKAVQVLANGKMIVAGYGREAAGGDTDPVLLRLNADGSADASFGANGTVKTHLSGSNDRMLGMQVQGDGKIVVLTLTGADASNLGGAIGVTRYNADGSLDTAFGSGGTARVSVHGIGEQPVSLVLAGGKIVVFGGTFNDTHFTGTNVIASLNADGSPDTGFGTANPSSLGGTVHADGYRAMALDANAAVYDADLAARGNYGGAWLTLSRHGGASADDQFSGVGEVSLAGGAIKVAGVTIGTAVQSGGTLTITFNSAATQGLVNRAMHGIGYANANSAPPGTVTIDWNFSDGNDGSQGFGAAKHATGSTTVQIGALVDEVSRSLADPTLTSTLTKLSSVGYMGRVQGTMAGDSFDAATGFSAAANSLMAEFQRGALFDMGPGDDTVRGTAWADNIIMGAGVNRVDGGGNGTAGRGDTLTVYAGSTADANAVRLTLLDASATGADKDAFAAGYTVKVVNGGETDYLKNMQQVDIYTWIDANGNHVRDSGETSFVRTTQLLLSVYSVAVSATDPTSDAAGNKLSSLFYLASAFGWNFDDSFNAATAVPAATLARMDTYQRGVYVDTGAGNDTIVGSAYGDTIVAGAGVNMVDGGANAGTDPNGYAARDYLSVYVNAPADVSAISVVQLTAASTGADHDAYAAGYKWKLSAPGETDYLKNVEQADVYTWTDTNGNGQRDSSERTYVKSIQLATRISEISVSGPDATKDTSGQDLATYGQMAWAYGTMGDDVIDASTLSATTQSLMAKYKAGMSFDTGDGNDVLTGTAYSDVFTPGAGVNKIDGGANDASGTLHSGRDVLQLYVSDQAAADAVAVTELTATMTGADGAAYAEGYRYKVTNGSVSTDYIKDVEAVSISIWTDKDGDGQRDYSPDTTKNEVTYVRTLLVGPQPNSAPVLYSDDMVRYAGDEPAPLFASVSDAELNKLGSYAGATLTLARHGGANADDVFAGSYGVSLADGILSVNGTAIGKAVNTGGTLTLTFDAAATRALVNTALYGIVYYNKAATQPSGSITLDWTFSDGNSGAQGTGGAQSATVSTQVQFGAFTDEIARSTTDATKSESGQLLAQMTKFAYVYGSGGADTVDAASLSASVRALMDEFHHGAVFRMGAGDDTVKGTAWDDAFSMGAGVNHVDGGGNGNANGHYVDRLDVETATRAAADAVQVVALDASATGADQQAFAAGYTVKVVNGAETDYLKNMQEVDVWVWNDANGNHVREADEISFVRSVALAVRVDEIQVSTTDPTRDSTGHLLSERFSFASITGSLSGDNIDPAARVSSATRTLMDTYQRGVYIDAGTGNDIIVGTGYGDMIVAGPGVNRVDGGANAGTDSSGHAKRDYLMIDLPAGASVNAVSAVKLTSGMSGDDAAAYAAGYTWKLSAPGETDYVNNIETVQVNGWIDANHDGVMDDIELGYREIRFTPQVNEVKASATDPTKDAGGHPLATYYAHFAWVNGTVGDDTLDASGTLSSATLALMSQYKKGVYFDTGAGNDVITGSAYGDQFVSGTGVHRIDGGDNQGTDFGGVSPATDELVLYVSSQAQADAVAVTELTASMTGDDGTAYAAGYRYKIANGTASTDYVKNVEAVSIWIWNDQNGNGQQDAAADGTDEVTFARSVQLGGTVVQPPAANTAPQLSVAGAISASGVHAAQLAGTGTIFDNELAQKSSYDGATLTVVRHGGAKAEDGFMSNDDNVSFDDGTLIVAGKQIGTATNTGGTLTLHFGAGADQMLVNQALRAIAYTNSSEAPPASLTLDWTLSDGNSGSQGSGGALAATASTVVTIELVRSEVARDPAHTDLSTEGGKLADYNWLGTVQGTVYGETFDAATGFSAAARGLMDEFKKGAFIATDGGGDHVTGTGYGDWFLLGKGVNYVDGGANASGADLLVVSVADTAAVNAVQVTRLTSGMQGADGTAFGQGYAFKVVAGAETDYVKGVEGVTVWSQDGSNTWRDIGLAVTVDPAISSSSSFSAYVTGTFETDQLDASATGTLLSQAIKDDMAATGRGVRIDGGDGNDVITGSAHGDYFYNGSGNAKIDGGANLDGNGADDPDLFIVDVASDAALHAVKVETSDDPNYTWKVTYGAGSSEVDYLKNVEAVVVKLNGEWASGWLPLTTSLVKTTGAHLLEFTGTGAADVIDATSGAGLVPADVQASMDAAKAGVILDGGAGDDRITGSAYGDVLVGGDGVNYIDGGANGGTDGQGNPAQDVLKVLVTHATPTVTKLDSTMSGADKAAFDAGYQFKLVAGYETDYVKNVEAYTLQVWDDANGNGQIDTGELVETTQLFDTAAKVGLVGVPTL